MTIELIIFANSIKHGACCVAAKTKDGKWARLVADKNGKELTKEQASIENPYGTFPVKPLQKVLVNLIEHAPLLNQPENYINDASTQWIQNYNLDFDKIANYLDSPTILWGDNKDRISYKEIQDGNIIITASLFLIMATKAMAYTTQFGKRRLSFTYNELQYDLPVTSPNFDNMEKNKEFDSIYLCISLGEPYLGDCYKIVANIFQV
ncbi:dual OB domain-containing protein [Pectobacterium versatile]|uniref:dual OB domain-containing protein n=1 Tax=Pectobacterium versatile TaxID=2488639 RepID=UPI000CFF91F2|nr:hypothetical protein [Pectobacterium versatile]PRI17396.1 hypothetical protein BZY99_22270 [Pectobacterium versatile]